MCVYSLYRCPYRPISLRHALTRSEAWPGLEVRYETLRDGVAPPGAMWDLVVHV